MVVTWWIVAFCVFGIIFNRSIHACKLPDQISGHRDLKWAASLVISDSHNLPEGFVWVYMGFTHFIPMNSLNQT